MDIVRFDALEIAAQKARSAFLRAIEAMGLLPDPRADRRRRMTGNGPKAHRNQRQLWRRRRAAGRGIKGGARK